MAYNKTELDFTFSNPQEKIKITKTQKKFGYMFENISEVEKFSDDVFKTIPQNSKAYNKIKKFSTTQDRLDVFNYWKANLTNKKLLDRYGKNDSSFIGQKLNRFINADKVEIEVAKLIEKVNKQSFVDIDQVKRIEFTEREAGVFSFDLASLGLVRVYEYYSPLLKSIVSSNLVTSEKNSNNKKTFYYIGTKYVPKHEVEYLVVNSQGGYFSKVLGRMVDKSELLQEEGQNKIVTLYYPEKLEIKKHEVERKQAKNKDGRDKFATTFKKCFIEIKKVKSRLPRVDIIVPIAYNSGVTSDEAFWNCIQIISICEKLSMSNINYRIIGSISDFLYENGDGRIYKFVKLKDENQPLDANGLSILVSDLRYYRISNFFFKQSAQYDAGFKDDLIDEISFTITNKDEIKTAYVNFLSKQTSESDREASQLLDSKIVLNYALSETEALQGYNNTIKEISKL